MLWVGVPSVPGDCVALRHLFLLRTLLLLLAWVHRADSTPRGHAPGQRQTWVWFMRFLDGFYLHPVRSLMFPFLYE